MADKKYQHRPRGDLMVSVERPLSRFGLSVTFGVGVGGETWVGKIMDDGSLMYTPTERGVIPHPTFFISDEELGELRRAIDKAPVHYPGDSRTEHLTDAVRVRDELLKMLASEQHNFYELAMQALRTT